MYRASGVALIRSQNVYNDGFHLDGLAFITDEDAKRLAQVEVKEGDVLLNITGDSVARVCQVPVEILPARVNQHVAIIRPRTDVLDAQFLRYFLVSPSIQAQLFVLASAGATRDALTKAMIQDLGVPAPPLHLQRAIAEMLGGFDRKIELNQRINKTLEAMARAIFKSWFVDFDPVRAKADGRQPAGMNAETAALFPRSFNEAVIGKVPVGWRVATLPEITEINPRHLLRKDTPATYLDMQNMPTHGHRILGWTRRPFVSGSRFTNGDTLIARITPCLENGKTAFVDFLGDGEVAWGSTEFIVLRPKEPLPPEYGYCLARDEEFRTHAIRNMTGSSGRQRVATNCFSQYCVAVPAKSISQRFEQTVRPLFAGAKANSEEAATLTAIRDTLLPKLISGEVRVRDVEKVVAQQI